MDLVGTCPKEFWSQWLEEGDLPGTEPTGQEYGWITKSRLAGQIEPGDRFYVVAHGKLRGYAPVVRIDGDASTVHLDYNYVEIVRAAGAVAVTIDEHIPGFRGLRKRWWAREDEKPFERSEDWMTP